MPKPNLLTKEQTAKIVGESAIAAVERVNCEPTNRVGYNGECQGDESTEWGASVECKDKSGEDCVLTAYYYTTNEQDAVIADTGDGSNIDWKIAGYEIA